MTKVVLWSSVNGDVPASIALTNNLNASAAPTVNDDASLGYEAGSQWIVPSTGTAYVCVDATAGAAVWAQSSQEQTSTGIVVIAQGDPVAKTTSATLTAADLLAGLITVDQGAGAGSNQQLPTGSDLQAALPASFAIDDAFDFSIINLGGASETATLTVNTDVTIVGAAAVAPGASGRFRARMSADGVFIVYRIS